MILVGEDPASATYVKNKVKACADAGVHSVLEKYDADLSEADLLARLAALNADPTIHGILVQMPLPRHIDPHKVIEAHLHRQGRRRLLGAERRRPDGRPAGLPPVHAVRLHEADREHRRAHARASTRS